MTNKSFLFEPIVILIENFSIDYVQVREYVISIFLRISRHMLWFNFHSRTHFHFN